mmetsp:Transcript_74943/g.231752  ORF Transcript_74943/g.231752 Transcript_74943/m.231752 type:complete len:275 (+) Transcript_74943:69-893(+)
MHCRCTSPTWDSYQPGTFHKPSRATTRLSREQRAMSTRRSANLWRYRPSCSSCMSAFCREKNLVPSPLWPMRRCLTSSVSCCSCPHCRTPVRIPCASSSPTGPCRTATGSAPLACPAARGCWPCVARASARRPCCAVGRRPSTTLGRGLWHRCSSSTPRTASPASRTRRPRAWGACGRSSLTPSTGRRARRRTCSPAARGASWRASWRGAAGSSFATAPRAAASATRYSATPVGSGAWQVCRAIATLRPKGYSRGALTALPNASSGCRRARPPS